MNSTFERNTTGPDARLKCAFYGRYSTTTARPKSIDDQFRICTEYAESRGWEIIADHIYGDTVLSGENKERRIGLEALMGAVKMRPRPFECILVDDTYRLGRDVGDVLRFTSLMEFNGVRVHFVAQQLDSADKNFAVMMNLYDATGQMYVEQLRKKVLLAQKDRVLQGFHVGSVPYGYRATPVYIADDATVSGRQTALGSKLEIVEKQALVVHRIFHLFADGHTVAAIPAQLNAEEIPYPLRVRSGQANAVWSNGAIKRILTNPIFRGEILWNVSRRCRHPLTGKVKKGIKPANEHVRVVAEHLRIVEDALWFKAAERLKRVNDNTVAFTAG